MSENPLIVPVALKTSPYEILIATGGLAHVGKFAKSRVKPCRCAIISDDVVASLHAQPLIKSLEEEGYSPTLFILPHGESSKSMVQAATLCDRLIDAGLDRKSAIFALGGGVIGDLAGFVASIYYRGIPVIQIPTTVVAQVDSSIGGKTGVNSPLGKNLIGSFHQPSLVITDPAILHTLPDYLFNEGLAEVIKHAVIADAAMLELLPPLKDSEDFSALIARNIAIKAAIVTQDEFETTGTRALLNFGHTIGHAVESVAGYGTYSHGEAVAIGMIAALNLSVNLAGLDPTQADRVSTVIKKCGLPTSIPSNLSTQELVTALGRDKKFDEGAMRFVLISQLGSAFVSDQVNLRDVISVIDHLKK